MPWTHDSVNGPTLHLSRATRLETGRPRELASRGRQCDHPGCRTVLSRYNPSPTCAAHDGWKDDPSRRQRG
jgi:hypothetical protein